MGYIGLAIAVVAVISALMPTPGMFIGMGLAILAIGIGAVGYRRRPATGWARLAGAGAITVAAIGLLISGGRYAMTLWAIDRLDSIL